MRLRGYNPNASIINHQLLFENNMKKIYFWNNVDKGRIPFWKPWGCMGCLGRFLGFLLLLAVLVLLLSLFRKCGSSDGDFSGRDREAGPSPADTTAWNSPIADAEEVGLPAPDDNQLPPFEEMEPVPNPDDGGATRIFPNLLYVIFDSESDDDTFKTFAKKFSSLYSSPNKIAYYNTGSKTAVLEVDETMRDDICRKLPEQISDVEFYVVPVEEMLQNASTVPNDPAIRDANKGWYFKCIQAQDAWTISQGSSDVIVGIVDSYMDLTHPELKGDRCIYPYSVINQNSDVSPRRGATEDYYCHGTLVTAVAVGNANNGQGSSGIAPKCKFIPVSMGDRINTVTMLEGLLYCMYHGASVINISAGSFWNESLIKRMSIDQQIAYSKQRGLQAEKMWDYVFKLAEKHNCTIVWAGGNQNCYAAMYNSKRNKNTIRVSALNRNLRKADFSNFGNFNAKGLYESTISAPGVDIYGAAPDNKYIAWPGTSFSAPIITGVVALLKSQNKDLTTAQIINILQTTGKPIAGNPEIGNLVQIKDALLKAKRTVASASTSVAVNRRSLGKKANE